MDTGNGVGSRSSRSSRRSTPCSPGAQGKPGEADHLVQGGHHGYLSHRHCSRKRAREEREPLALDFRHDRGSGVVLTVGQGDTGQLGLGEDVMEKSRPQVTAGRVVLTSPPR